MRGSLYASQTDCKLPTGTVRAGRPARCRDRTYTLLREADAYCIRAQRDTAPAVECMVCDTGEERVGMLTRFLYENAVEPAQVPAVLYDLCGSAVG